MTKKRRGRRGPQIKPQPSQSSIGILISSYLSKHELTVMDLAREMGVTDHLLRSWFSGKHFPKVPSIIMMAEVISKHEECFIETIMLEIMKTHDDFIKSKRRERRRYERRLGV